MRKLLALVFIVLFGLAKLQPEHQLALEHRAAFFHGAQFSLELRQQIGQMAFVAALSGFRSLIADLLWIESNSAWERTEWGRMNLLFNNVTALQPRAIMFWDMAAWHMAWNASVAARENPKLPREALRIKAQREYFEIGRDFLIRGIQNNPDRYQLYERLALLYREKFKDAALAFEQYDKAAQFQEAPEYMKRFAAYSLAESPGREREAYERLRSLYLMGEHERLPTLLSKLAQLQDKLGIPIQERVYHPAANPKSP